MEPSLILRSDALEILFENRNKQYGAYALRRNYPQNLLAGLGAMGLLVVLAIYFSGFYPKNSNNDHLFTTTVCLFTDSLQLTAIPARPKAVVPPPAGPQKQVTTVKSTTPVLVPDDLAETLPDQESLANAQIGELNRSGDPNTGPEPIPFPENGQGAPAAPVAPPVEEGPEILEKATVMPAFPGGTAALQKWLSRQLRPQETQEAGQKTRVVVRFVVDSNGEISRIHLARSAGEPFDSEVLRVLNKMPRWIPGQQNGRPISLWFTIPVIFETPEQ